MFLLFLSCITYHNLLKVFDPLLGGNLVNKKEKVEMMNNNSSFITLKTALWILRGNKVLLIKSKDINSNNKNNKNNKNNNNNKRDN